MLEKYDMGDYSTKVVLSRGSFRFIIQNILPGSRILEFGPSSGHLTRYLFEELKCKVTCVEINPNFAYKCSDFSEKILIGDIDTQFWVSQIDDKFDYIVFADVLEHLRDPFTTLSNCRNFLKDGGMVLTSIPNIGHNSILINLYKDIFMYRSEGGLLDSTHIHFFTYKSIYELFSSMNYQLVCEDYEIVLPVNTEFKNTYFKYWFLIPFLLFRSKGHVYQFFNSWKLKNGTSQVAKESRNSLNFVKNLYWFLYDFLIGFKRSL